MTTGTAANPSLRAALWMTGAIGSFSFMAVAGRWLTDASYDTFEIMLYRSIVGVIVVFAVGAAMGTLGQITTRKAHLHIVRNLFHFSGQNLWFYAISLIPLAQVFALEFTSPIWVLVLAPLILGEQMTRTKVIAALFGFAGILVVTRPGAVPISTGVVTAATAAMCFAMTMMITKRLTRTESLTCILAYLTVTQLIYGLICAGWDGDIALPTSDSAVYLGLVGLAGLLAHLCVTKALSLAPATVVVPIDFVRLPVIAVAGMVLFGETLDPWVFVGALLIFGGNYLNIRAETRKSQ